MINKLEISGIHTEVDQDLKKYIKRKIGRLDQYLPAHSKESAHAEIKLREMKVKARTECTCEVILHLPHDTLIVKETTINSYAAVDVVEEKLKNQIKKYKQKNGKGRLRQRILARLKRTSGAIDLG